MSGWWWSTLDLGVRACTHSYVLLNHRELFPPLISCFFLNFSAFLQIGDFPGSTRQQKAGPTRSWGRGGLPLSRLKTRLFIARELKSWPRCNTDVAASQHWGPFVRPGLVSDHPVMNWELCRKFTAPAFHRRSFPCLSLWAALFSADIVLKASPPSRASYSRAALTIWDGLLISSQ